MKKLISLSVMALFSVAAVAQSNTQQHTTTTTTQNNSNGYNNGNTTNTTTTTTTTDQTYPDHWGPHGETVYMTHNKKYYYKDKGGKRHYGGENSFKTKEKVK